MSEEKTKIEVGIGEKGEAPTDAEIVELVKPEENEDEVGGRCKRMSSVVCPYCYAVNRILEETTYRIWFRCWNCRSAFQY